MMNNNKPHATRRSFLNVSLALGALASPVLAQAQQSASAGESSCDGAMSLAEYQRYVELFNNNDERFIDYYHPDVELVLSGSSIQGAEGIREFYAEVKQYIRETVMLERYVGDASGIAVIIPTRFECIRDWDDSFWGWTSRPARPWRSSTGASTACATAGSPTS